MFVEFNLDCVGKPHRNVTLSAYYPDLEDGELYDKNGEILNTLQDFLDFRAQFITLAMDENLKIPYATPVCIPELNKHFGHRLRIEIRDSSVDLKGMGFKRADICVRSESDSYDIAVNRRVTIVF